MGLEITYGEIRSKNEIGNLSGGSCCVECCGQILILDSCDRKMEV